MKFIAYSIDDINHIGVIKNNKIYKTKYEFIYELFDLDLNQIEILDEETRIIKEEPIIKYPRQDILCIGMNYYEHKKECLDAGFDNNKKAVSVYFSKRCNKAITNSDYIDLHTDITDFVDYEGELGVILKKDIYKATTNKEIEDSIFGYCIINDVSARDLQKNHEQFHFGKSLDTFTVISSTIVSIDEFEGFPKLDLKTYINNELRQNNNTSNMIFDIPYLIKEFSSGCTLLSGTIISTGTPSGIGKSLNKPLKSGDLVRVEIERIGYIENRCK